MYVFLLVGLDLGEYGAALYGGDGGGWGAVDTGAASGYVGGGGIGACTLCSHTVILGGVRIGSDGTV